MQSKLAQPVTLKFCYQGTIKKIRFTHAVTLEEFANKIQQSFMLPAHLPLQFYYSQSRQSEIDLNEGLSEDVEQVASDEDVRQLLAPAENRDAPAKVFVRALEELQSVYQQPQPKQDFCVQSSQYHKVSEDMRLDEETHQGNLPEHPALYLFEFGLKL